MSTETIRFGVLVAFLSLAAGCSTNTLRERAPVNAALPSDRISTQNSSATTVIQPNCSIENSDDTAFDAYTNAVGKLFGPDYSEDQHIRAKNLGVAVEMIAGWDQFRSDEAAIARLMDDTRVFDEFSRPFVPKSIWAGVKTTTRPSYRLTVFVKASAFDQTMQAALCASFARSIRKQLLPRVVFEPVPHSFSELLVIQRELNMALAEQNAVRFVSRVDFEANTVRIETPDNIDRIVLIQKLRQTLDPEITLVETSVTITHITPEQLPAVSQGS